MRRLSAVLLVATLVASPVATVSVQGASAFGDPGFERQWRQGEAIVPNFWGPLATAGEWITEPYTEGAGGRRTVQYFDKGRMELTNGAVTDGLLATEMIRGQVQTGDATFEPRAPAGVLMAGDQVSGGEIAASVPLPTYHVVSTVDALTKPTTPKLGTATTLSLQRFGGSPLQPPSYAPNTYPNGATFPLANVSAFDDATKHNVPQGFADYRATAGVGTIGLAIIEPFWSPVKIAGVTKEVLIQAFERRVLTYTPDNPPAFRVEMGNVGQHYHEWRYGAHAPLTVIFTGVSSPVKAGNMATASVRTAPGAACAIIVIYDANRALASKDLVGKTADLDGLVSWTWLVYETWTPGSYAIDVQCSGDGQRAMQHTMFTVT